ncbi:MAG: 30S ribosomal protein S4 [Candidatus Aenigmarchaeota archaeon CG_4_10_14_0_8_um_filter_37_24]|nr:30S ribosomal protein S4 [Candidatus Aenigmarchaeota archaeon]OIN88652.1 MAG: 30S ribosomal protein S4 [Candidatus Aenigmarchaeota archaeon CG1_02_38_14]PIV68448.1 MAG: 30S ribosomal protein S4 [Candidatus Aenigmarchaeota archaeon CG01_land_8_20_14_3_00_37_9]PIW40791.1 MAG: 30S ribosomal protein S4 [Candidatus Aenigmarchaeota archaeon CG15_BIG_FIL_POST_REV_8_21_14_020_37_27]PIX50619.1 MAG: 30S ribosomal protein S4 [Candidatus Aenigmarchaeota archaeon CG_4_8_14_3_um_filter_37_24]PIY35519.1 M
MRKMRSIIKKPLRPWDKERIDQEKKLLQKYGLRRKREIWKVESILRNYRHRARVIEAKDDKNGEKILLDYLYKMGIIEKRDVDLGSVLGLKIDNILNRRLQTIVLEKGLANTATQSRQLITHGHIAIDERRTVFPSYLVPRDLEGKIEYYGKFTFEKIEKPKSKAEPEEKPKIESDIPKKEKPAEVQEAKPKEQPEPVEKKGE